MEVKRTLWAIGTSLFAGLVIVGCNPKPPLSKKAKNKKQEATLPGAIQGENWKIAWRTRNPLNRNALAPPVLTGIAENGKLSGDELNPTLQLETFTATLYHKGKPTAHIIAPKVNADQKRKKVVATGGVTVTSIASGVITKSDRVTWTLEGGKIVGEGNVSSFRAATGKQPAISQNGNKFTYDPESDRSIIE